MIRAPEYRALDDPDYPRPVFRIVCAKCGTSNGWVWPIYSAGRLIGARVRLDRRLSDLAERHGSTGLPIFGPSSRSLKGKQPRLRVNPDARIREMEASVSNIVTTVAPSRLWMRCLDPECNTGHLLDPVAQLVPNA